MEKQKITIDNVSYEMGYWNPDTFLKHVTVVGKIISPVIATLLEKSVNQGSSFLDSKLDMAKVFKQVFENWDNKEVFEIIEDLKKSCVSEVEGTKTQLPLKASYDGLFTGKTGNLMKWLKWGFEVQFKDFFSEIKEQIAGG